MTIENNMKTEKIIQSKKKKKKERKKENNQKLHFLHLLYIHLS